MSLDVKEMKRLEIIALSGYDEETKVFCGFTYANNIPLPPSSYMLRHQYLKYFAKCYQEYKEKQLHHGYGHGV